MITTADQPEVSPRQAPGIYPGLSFDEYRAIDAINVSTLAWARDSALHLKAAIEGRLERKDTAALAFGRALHVRLLEPDTFAERFPVMPDFGDMRSSKNRAERDAWLDQRPGCEPITRDQLAQIEACAEAVKRHPGEALRRCKGDFEVVVVAELAGVLCKGRLDKFIPDPLTIVDVKKVAAATSPGSSSGGVMEFEKRIATYGYGMQAAFYCDLIAAHHEGKRPRWYWIVVEDNAPHAVGIYKATDELLNAGRNEYLTYMSQLRVCRESGKWPGFTASVEEVSGPSWWLKTFGGTQ